MRKGDEVKKGDSLEYWIKDSLWGMSFSDDQITKIAEILRPLGSRIEGALKLYDEEIDNWRHFRIAIWSRIPKKIENRIAKLIDSWLREGSVSGSNRDRIS